MINLNDEKITENSEFNKPEIVLDYTNNEYGELKIDLNFDENLSRKRKLLEKESNSLFKNILVVFFDSISRNKFIHKMPRTVTWIEKFMKRNNNNKIRTFQFLKYHCFRYNTWFNTGPMFFGIPFDKKLYPDKNIKHTAIINYLQQLGYVTGYSLDECSKEFYYLYEKDFRNHSNYYGVNDHEFISVFCDPTYTFVDRDFGITAGSSSILQRCLYGKPVYEYQFEYVKQFWEKYKDNRKFFRLGFNYAHESLGQAVKLMDRPLMEFLDEFYNKGYLNETELIIVSDHGFHFFGLETVLNKDEQKISYYFPTLFVALPNKKGEKYERFYDNMYLNEQVMITSYDIFQTMIHTAFGDDYCVNKEECFIPKSEYGESLLKKIDGKMRNCSNYLEINDAVHCKCNK